MPPIASVSDGARFKRVPQYSKPFSEPASVSFQTWQRLNHHPPMSPKSPKSHCFLSAVEIQFACRGGFILRLVLL